MSMEAPFFGYLIVAAYLLCSAYTCHHFTHKEARSTTLLLIVTPVLTLHLIWLLGNLFVGSDLDLSLTNLISLVSLFIATPLTLGHKRFNSQLLLPPIYLFNAVALLPDLLIDNHYLTHFNHNPGLAIHIALALIAYSIFIMAALLAILVWIIDYRLKNRGSLQNLPPLVIADRQLSMLLKIGFVTLTLSIMTGWYFLDNFFAHGQRHKALFTLLAWAIYGWMIWKDYREGLSSRQIATLSMITGFILTLAYFGSRFVREVILG